MVDHEFLAREGVHARAAQKEAAGKRRGHERLHESHADISPETADTRRLEAGIQTLHASPRDGDRKDDRRVQELVVIVKITHAFAENRHVEAARARHPLACPDLHPVRPFGFDLSGTGPEQTDRQRVDERRGRCRSRDEQILGRRRLHDAIVGGAHRRS